MLKQKTAPKSWTLPPDSRYLLWKFWSLKRPPWVAGIWDDTLCWAEELPDSLQPFLLLLGGFFFGESISTEDYALLWAGGYIPGDIIPSARENIEAGRSQPVPAKPTKGRQRRLMGARGKAAILKAMARGKEVGRASLGDDGMWTAVEWDRFGVKRQQTFPTLPGTEGWLKKIPGVTKVQLVRKEM